MFQRTRAYPAIVEQQRREEHDLLAMDAEVAAIHQVVVALETLSPESVKRVLDYANARFGKLYQFEDGAS